MKLVGALGFVVFMLATSNASASSCDEGCAIAVDTAVAVGGIASSVGMQVELIRGEPSKEWELTGAAFGAANVVGGCVLLIASVLADDEDTATALRILGGVQLSIAAGDAIGVGVTEYARHNEIVIPQPSSSEAAPQAAGIGIGFSF